MENNLGKWDFSYKDAEMVQPYGDDTTYLLGWKFLKDCKQIEDWGCGLAYFKTFVPLDRYKGIDGSCSRFADHIADLAHYTSITEGLFHEARS